jgi:hypothetical protein
VYGRRAESARARAVAPAWPITKLSGTLPGEPAQAPISSAAAMKTNGDRTCVMRRKEAHGKTLRSVTFNVPKVARYRTHQRGSLLQSSPELTWPGIAVGT